MDKYKILLAAILFFITQTFAQNQADTSKAASEFSLGLDLYNSEQYQEAQQIFNGIIINYTFNSWTTISYIFKGKALLQQKKYADAEKVLLDFINKYSSSSYVEEARLTLAKSYFEQENYLSAFKVLNELIAGSTSPFYSSYAQSTAEKIALGYLKAEEIKTLYDSTSNKKLKPFLLLLAGKFYIKNGNIKEAENTLSEVIHLYPESEEKSDAAILYQKLLSENNTAITTPVLGVMLPLTNESEIHSNAAGEILEGIKYAVSEYNKTHLQKVGLLIRNTERKKSEIEKIKNEFEGIKQLKAVIGPLFSDEVKETLEAFKNTDIPIISPTATENNLTELYPNFFQANPSFTIRGKVMAEYIYYVENKKRMAVFNANQGYSPILAEAFIKEFKRLGGKIIIQQTYNSNSVSYSEQVTKIAADSASIDGLYLPLVDKRDVPIILSQFLISNLNIPIYGNQDWFQAKGYESSSTISNTLTFTSDYFIDYSDSSFQEFNKDFLLQTNIDVDRNVLYGFDTAEYLLDVIKDFNNDRKTILSDMESGLIFKGFHNNYFFNQDRVNNFLNIIRYRDGKFELVDKFKLSN